MRYNQVGGKAPLARGDDSSCSAPKRKRERHDYSCAGCGSFNHVVAKCIYSDSVFYNPDHSMSYIESEYGKAYFAVYKGRYIKAQDLYPHLMANDREGSNSR